MCTDGHSPRRTVIQRNTLQQNMYYFQEHLAQHVYPLLHSVVISSAPYLVQTFYIVSYFIHARTQASNLLLMKFLANIEKELH